MKYKNRRVAVLGLGTSGEAAAQLLCQEGAEVVVFDSARPEVLSDRIAAMTKLGARVMAGEAAENTNGDFDTIVLSPGIDPSAPLVQNFARRGARFTGELELAYELCRKPVIAITGTNGKTTTTQLVELMLNRAGVRTIACGNIGIPFCEAVRKQGELDAFTVEVSSFQLETIRSFRPDVAVWLNLTPDHLDRYASVEEYRAAKLRIFDNQRPEDFAVVNLRDKLPDIFAQRVTFSAYSSEGDFCRGKDAIHFRGAPVLDMKETHLAGVHNAENLMAALGVAFGLGIPWQTARTGLQEYRLLPHRCENVGEIGGVRFINDSKATNLDALSKALESQQSPVVLIAGGKDKGFDFDSVTQLVGVKVKHAVLIGEMAERIHRLWRGVIPCSLAASLGEAVTVARSKAIMGDVVLFSPGTSSFDMFRNYADRGDQFRQIVQKLKM
jgi:UDP-N-acetylmuramoylalanine--D-glutamate ligase